MTLGLIFVYSIMIANILETMRRFYVLIFDEDSANCRIYTNRSWSDNRESLQYSMKLINGEVKSGSAEEKILLEGCRKRQLSKLINLTVKIYKFRVKPDLEIDSLNMPLIAIESQS